MSRFTSCDELRAAVGESLGVSDWLLVDQRRIDTFAEATGDDQWIHVDPSRAAEGPFGTTIAHGYLTLSMLPVLVASVVDYEGWRVKINYGSNTVRYPAPLRVDSRVRAQVTLAGVEETPAGVRVRLAVTVEAEQPDGSAGGKPALVAETITLLADPITNAAPTN